MWLSWVNEAELGSELRFGLGFRSKICNSGEKVCIMEVFLLDFCSIGM